VIALLGVQGRRPPSTTKHPEEGNESFGMDPCMDER
jgi:hypothetical protein